MFIAQHESQLMHYANVTFKGHQLAQIDEEKKKLIEEGNDDRNANRVCIGSNSMQFQME